MTTWFTIPRRLCLSGIAGFAVVILGSGCSTLETGPSRLTPPALQAPSSALQLNVRVYSRASEIPIQGAQAVYNAQGYYTNESGEALILVAAGQEATIAVSAPGYEPMTAAAVLTGPERWTFYLASQPSE